MFILISCIVNEALKKGSQLVVSLRQSIILGSGINQKVYVVPHCLDKCDDTTCFFASFFYLLFKEVGFCNIFQRQ